MIENDTLDQVYKICDLGICDVNSASPSPMMTSRALEEKVEELEKFIHSSNPLRCVFFVGVLGFYRSTLKEMQKNFISLNNSNLLPQSCQHSFAYAWSAFLAAESYLREQCAGKIFGSDELKVFECSIADCRLRLCDVVDRLSTVRQTEEVNRFFLKFLDSEKEFHKVQLSLCAELGPSDGISIDHLKTP